MDRSALVTVNPAAGVQTEIAPARDRLLKDDELRAVWSACGEVGTFGAMTRAMILSMARRSEVAEMPRAELSATEWTMPRPAQRTAAQ